MATTASRHSSYNCLNGFDSYDKIPRVRVEYYVNENTFKEKLQLYFIKNQRSSTGVQRFKNKLMNYNFEGLRIRIANFILRILICIVYIVRVMNNPDPIYATCFDCEFENKTEILFSRKLSDEQFRENPKINWSAIFWVHRTFEIWCLQTVLAVISLSQTLLISYLCYKGNVFSLLLSFHFVMDFCITVPFVLMVFFPSLRNLFVPIFLNCWIAKKALENMFNDLHRALQKSQSALSQQLTILTATLVCLAFTRISTIKKLSICGIQHFQRAGHRNLSLFQSTYLVIVTFSTVGYGDLVPDIWPSQVFVVFMICAALIVLPTQFEQLAFTWMERQKLGGSYSSHRSNNEKHVVVCSTNIHADTVMDFLNEFYAHPMLKDHYVILLSPMELDTTMRLILQIPMWAHRVVYIQGSCLKESDLVRARMNEAQACFILAARNYADKAAADEHTILRSWAVKDFAPDIPQYVQIFRPENKLHVKFAEFVVCEDEFKYALLANNCICPGASTLVTLLLHTSRGEEGQHSDEEWQKLYGRCSGNEVYHIVLKDSQFFGEYEGKSFTYASFHSHKKYGVALVGVRPLNLPEFYEDTILLNPGPKHVMNKSDICFYMSITKEENSSFDNDICDDDQIDYEKKDRILLTNLSDKPNNRNYTKNETSKLKNADIKGSFNNKGVSVTNYVSTNFLEIPKIACDSTSTESFLSPDSIHNKTNRRPSILPVPDKFSSSTTLNLFDYPHNETGEDSDDELEDGLPWRSSSEKIGIVKGFPPVSPYIGISPTLCFLLKEKKPLCCLQLSQVCEHCSYRNAKDYNWQNKAIILATDYASNGIYNFIIPLRAHFHTKSSLNPIILLLERRPDIAFLDSISYFPLVYWMQGTIDSLDDLLRAGIILAKNIVVVNKELSNSIEEDSLADCNTIVSVQTIFKFFPTINCITELSHSSNMKFMQFKAKDKYALHLSKTEKKEKERGSHISYIFRLPFAAGNVFSASMLDTLLYQAFVKDYVITFVRLLLGVDQAPGSGFLTSLKIAKEDMWIRTYGRLYQKLCSTSFEIPIGVYRTKDTTNANESVISCDEGDSDNVGVTYKPKTGTSCLACVEVEKSVFSINVYDEEKNKQEIQIERAEIANLVRSRMENLNLPQSDYSDVSENNNNLSFVIINPSFDLKLEEGDLIYVIRPSPFSAKKTFERHSNRRKSTMSFCSQVFNPNSYNGSQNVSAFCFSENFSKRHPSLGSINKVNSCSLPESPRWNKDSMQRVRSSSLRVLDETLLRRSSSLRQSFLHSQSVDKNSLENINNDIFCMESNVRIALNNNIGLEITPPEDSVSQYSLSDISLPSTPKLFYNSCTTKGQSLNNLTEKPKFKTASHQNLNLAVSSCFNFSENTTSTSLNNQPFVCSQENLKGTVV